MQRKAAAGEVFDRVEQQKAEGQKKTASEKGGNTKLSESDLEEYLRVGVREHVRNTKIAQVRAGQSPILTTLAQIRDFVKSSISGGVRNTIKAYGRVGSKMASDIARKANIDLGDLTGYYLELDANRLQHLSDHIQEDGDKRNEPLTEEQALNITEYIDSYDDVLEVIPKKDGRVRVTLGKRINGHAIIVELISKGRHSLQPVTAWQNTTEHYLKKYGKEKTPVDASQPAANTEGESGYKPVSSEATVPQSAGEVNPSVFEQAIMDTAAQGRQLQAEKEAAARTPQDETMERVLAEMNASKRGQGNNPSVSSADTSPYTGEAMGAPEAQASAQGTTVKTDTAVRTNAPAASQGEKPKMGVVDARTAKDAASLRNVLSDREVLYLDRVAQAAGIRINIVDAQYGEGAADGWYENGEIYLTENCEDPVAWVATHELTHHLERAAPEAYRQYQEYVKKILTDEGGLEEQIARIRQHYAERNVDLTEEGAMRELAANFTERLRLDEDLFRRIAGENRNLAQRLLDSLKEFIRKVRRKLSGKQLSDLERTRQAWERALKESRGKTVETAERRYRIAGGDAEQKRSARKYDYNELIAKPDMKLTVINDAAQYTPNQQTRKQIIQDAIKNAAAIGVTNERGEVSVYVSDIGLDVMLSGRGLKHGLDRRLQQNAPATLKAGEILQNAIRINELVPDNKNASNTYVLLGAAKNAAGELYIVEFVVNRFDNSVESMSVLYSVNTKKESAVLNAPKPTGNPLLVTDSTISIARLLDLAREKFPDVLPESVLRHYGYKARPGGILGESALFSLRGARDMEHQVADLQKQNARLQARNEELRSRLESGGTVKVDGDIKTVQGNLGHATAAFTLDVYGHVTDQMKQASAARMEGCIKDVLSL